MSPSDFKMLVIPNDPRDFFTNDFSDSLTENLIIIHLVNKCRFIFLYII